MERVEEQDIEPKKNLHKSRDGEITVFLAALRSNPRHQFVLKKFDVADPMKFNRYNQVLLSWCRIKNGNLAELTKVLLSGGKNPDSVKGIFKYYSHTLSTVLELGHRVPTREFLVRILTALAMLYRKTFVHGNICPENVLFEMNGDTPVNIVLCGQRCLCSIAKNDLNLVRQYKNMNYASPELMQVGKVTHESDLYSCGLLGLQLEFGVSIQEILKRSGAINELVAQIRDDMVRYIVQLTLQTNPVQRTTAESILQSLSVDLPPDLTTETRFGQGQTIMPSPSSPTPLCAYCSNSVTLSQDIECCGYFAHPNCIINSGSFYGVCPTCGTYLIGSREVTCNRCNQYNMKLRTPCQSHFYCEKCFPQQNCQLCEQQSQAYFPGNGHQSPSNSGNSTHFAAGQSPQQALPYSGNHTQFVGAPHQVPPYGGSSTQFAAGQSPQQISSGGNSTQFVAGQSPQQITGHSVSNPQLATQPGNSAYAASGMPQAYGAHQSGPLSIGMANEGASTAMLSTAGYPTGSQPGGRMQCHICKAEQHQNKSCLAYSVHTTERVLCPKCNSPCERRRGSYYAGCLQCNQPFCFVCQIDGVSHAACRDRFCGIRS